MVMDRAFETLIGQADPVETAALMQFIRNQDMRYAWLALEYREPYTPLTDDEVRDVATLASALGVRAGAFDAALSAAPRPAAPERELVGGR